MTADYEFSEPPPARAGTRLYSAMAQTLRENPGKWALVRTVHYRGGVVVSVVKQAGSPAFAPAGSFQAVSRATGVTDDKGRRLYGIWARYVGDHQEYADIEADMAPES